MQPFTFRPFLPLSSFFRFLTPPSFLRIPIFRHKSPLLKVLAFPSCFSGGFTRIIWSINSSVQFKEAFQYSFFWWSPAWLLRVRKINSPQQGKSPCRYHEASDSFGSVLWGPLRDHCFGSIWIVSPSLPHSFSYWSLNVVYGMLYKPCTTGWVWFSIPVGWRQVLGLLHSQPSTHKPSSFLEPNIWQNNFRKGFILAHGSETIGPPCQGRQISRRQEVTRYQAESRWHLQGPPPVTHFYKRGHILKWSTTCPNSPTIWDKMFSHLRTGDKTQATFEPYF